MRRLALVSTAVTVYHLCSPDLQDEVGTAVSGRHRALPLLRAPHNRLGGIMSEPAKGLGRATLHASSVVFMFLCSAQWFV